MTGPIATAIAIEEKLLSNYLRDKAGYSPAQISAAIYKLTTEANDSHRGLYGNNHAVYKLLRYGVDVKTEAGKPTDKIWLINWDRPEENDFAIAEEVTLKRGHERRPDLVLYINGIAIGVIELKRSSIGIGEGIRQTYEERAKKLFVDEPANMKLLVVVAKLLTGFDAPSCTYLYIDKTMRDHDLFQAICRTNRLDGEDKDFGYIVDYKDLFKNLVARLCAEEHGLRFQPVVTPGSKTSP